MQRVSVTTLEKFRRFMAGETSFDTEESLIESLKGIFKGNDKTRVGSAYHKIFEGDYLVHDNIVTVTSENQLYAFTMEQAIHAIKYYTSFPQMVHEMDISMIYETTFGPIQVSGRVDGLNGNTVRDGKTKYKAVLATEYMNSCQWKFYLEMLNLNLFYFDVFEFIGFETLNEGTPKMIPGVTVVPHEPIECLRYANMEQDNSDLLHDFLHYIENRGFWHLLKPAKEEAELNF
jgi:hypothetical protein